MRFVGRTWHVRVSKGDDVLESQELRKEAAKKEREQRKKEDRDAEEIEQALKVIRRDFAGGLSKANLQQVTGWGAPKVTRVMAMLLAKEFLKDHGKRKERNGKAVDWYGLVQQPTGE